MQYFDSKNPLLVRGFFIQIHLVQLLYHFVQKSIVSALQYIFATIVYNHFHWLSSIVV